MTENVYPFVAGKGKERPEGTIRIMDLLFFSHVFVRLPLASPVLTIGSEEIIIVNQLRMDEMKLQNIIYSIFVLFVFTLLAGCSSAADQQIAAKPLFPARHGWDLRQVTISDADTSLDFKRVNCVWVVGNDNEPSDEPRVTALADKLVTLIPQGLVTEELGRFENFKVGDANFSRKVVLTFKDNSSFTLLIGSPALTKPAYVRLADKKEVYMVDEPLFKQINLNTGSWLAPEEG